MSVKLIIGSFWGDEGKGKCSYYESQNADIVIRATGGSNAGHTVIVNDKKYALHLLPSSIINPNVLSIIGPGVVIDLKELHDEMELIKKASIRLNLIISDKASIVLPENKEMDAFIEEHRTKPVGTTGRGIGPAYADKCYRIALRMCDLTKNIPFDIIGFKSISPTTSMLLASSKTLNFLNEFKNYFKDYICDTQQIINNAIFNDKKIIIEGAQATYLDKDHGDYPYVTSSNPIASGACCGAGIGPKYVTEVYGVMKAYCSRVGEGPFPTELFNEIGNSIRELGHEYGTTTKRPRRCGWLDLVRAKNAVVLNSFTYWTVNHIDTLGKIGEKYGEIKVCTAYNYKGKKIDYVPTNLTDIKPIYQTFTGGWSTEGCKTYEDLPIEAKNYIKFIEDYTKVPVKYIGIGPDNKDVIIKET